MLLALGMIPELNFLRDFHVTQAGIMAAASMGGLKNPKTLDFMHPGSIPDGATRQGAGWQIYHMDSKPAEADFRTAVRMGLVSQFVFDCMTVQ